MLINVSGLNKQSRKRDPLQVYYTYNRQGWLNITQWIGHPFFFVVSAYRTVDINGEEEIKGHGSHEVKDKPALEVMGGYPDGAEDDLALLVHVSRSEVENDVWK